MKLFNIKLNKLHQLKYLYAFQKTQQNEFYIFYRLNLSFAQILNKFDVNSTHTLALMNKHVLIPVILIIFYLMKLFYFW